MTGMLILLLGRMTEVKRCSLNLFQKSFLLIKLSEDFSFNGGGVGRNVMILEGITGELRRLFGDNSKIILIIT